MSIIINNNPIIAEVTITDEEQEIKFDKCYKMIFCIDGVGTAKVSISDNDNYVTYYATDDKVEIYNSGGIEKVFVKSNFPVSTQYNDAKIRLWGYK